MIRGALAAIGARPITLVLSAFPAVFAVIVLIGWGIDDEDLKRLGMASATMNPTTAMGFIALSLGLMLRRVATPSSFHIATILIALAAALGIAKLFDAITGSQFHIDAILFASKLTHGDVRPSRIAPNAALCFALIGAALLIMPGRSERGAIATQLLALAAGLVSIFAVVGYLYGIGAFYIVPAFFPMAIHTAIAFLCVVAVVFIQTAQRGLMVPLSDSGPAGKTSRALLPAAVAIPVGLGWLRQTGERAGLYTSEIGVALMVMATVLILTMLIWWNGRALLVSDTRRRSAEARLARMATHDYLTSLPNRGHFMERLMARMSGGRLRAEDSFAIIYMDLDGFKQVNDRLGHAAGDQLLQEVATYLRNQVRRKDDLVARIGGDEFAMLIDRIVSSGEAISVAERIVSEMPSRFGPADNEVPVGISLGIVVADIRHQTPEALLNDADLALYDAKRGGKGRFSVYPFVTGTDAA